MNTKNRTNKFITYTLIATENRFVSDMFEVARMLTKSLGHLCYVIPPSVFLAKGDQDPVGTLIKGSDMTIVFTTPDHDIAKIVTLVRGEFATYVSRVIRLTRRFPKPALDGVDQTVRRNDIFLYGKLARWRVEDRFCNLAQLQ